MIEKIVEFLLSITSNTKLITALISAIPLIELKGAIPMGVKLGNSLFVSALFAYIGSTLVFFIVFFLLIPIFNLLKRIKFIKKLVVKIETMLKNKAKKIAEKRNESDEKSLRRFLIITLFIFVSLPLPVTGVWTGTAIAVFLKMKFKDSILPLALGNLVAGSLITLLIYIFKEYVDLFIYCLLIIALIMLVITIIKVSRTKVEKEEGDTYKADDAI